MANPNREALLFLTGDLPNLPAGTTASTSFPVAAIAVPHVQFAWDGTPSDADNREDVALRFTVWTPLGKATLAQDIAGGLRARVLDYSSPAIQRIDRGSGRLPGVDSDTKLPFCTFTVNLVLRALTA